MKTKNISFIILLVLLNLNISQAQKDSYIGIDKEQISIGNKYIERILLKLDNRWVTKFIVNKLSGKNYEVKSEELSLFINFAGFGPAYGKTQNGENLVELTIKDFSLNKIRTDELSDQKFLIFEYSLEGYSYNFQLKVIYCVPEDKPYIKKWLEISDLSSGIHFLDFFGIENLEFSNANYTHGEFGQPVFNSDIFLGGEYPGIENKIQNKSLKIGYVLGEKITSNVIKSHPSVIGVSPSEKLLELYFLKYVEDIKVNGTRPYLLYNTWYDLRNPAIVNNPEAIINEKNVLRRIQQFKEKMFDKHNIKLDAFVLDDGWDNYRSIWAIDTNHFPNKFYPFIKPLSEMNTSLGIWASPFCGYSNRDIRVNWGSEHGYERVGEFLCFAGKNYKREFEKRMVEYTKEFKIGYFKWDGFLLACNELDHGHLPGIYSRRELIDTYIHMMNSVRKVNPDIYINVTVGSWLSPWWLKYADCLWMQGEDYAYAEDVPSLNPRDKAISYRDAVLWGNFQKQKLLFPMSSLMTHGIIKGQLNLLGGKNESLESFTNEVMMYFGRGVMMWELYISPDLLSDAEWEAIAKSLKWVKQNQSVLKYTKMFLGNPLKREVYGFAHLDANKGIIILRNPFIDKQSVTVKIDSTLGLMNSNQEYFVKITYPYNKVLSEKITFPGEFNVQINGYEILVCELIPENELLKNTPIGIRYEINEQNQVIVYNELDTAQTYSIFPSKQTKKFVNLNLYPSLEFSGFEGIKLSDKTLNGKLFIYSPYNYSNLNLTILIGPDTNLTSSIYPEVKAKVNGKYKDVTMEQENGKWFFFSIKLEGGKNNIELTISFKDNITKNITFYFTGDKILQGEMTDLVISDSKSIDPPKPYSIEIQKMYQKIYQIKK